MTDRLFIAARAPRPGFTKTRLGRVVGHQAAAAIYRAFLTDLANRFANVSFDVGWYVTPPNAWPEILDCLRQSPPSSTIIPQPDGDWTTRQRALFTGMPARNEDRTILIASDSPHLPVEHVSRAFDVLTERDLVFGPVHDGGYYLIGMRTPRAADVLAGVPMSNGGVLCRLLDRAGALGLSVGLVEATFDIDEFEDLEQLGAPAIDGSELAATLQALTALGLLAIAGAPHELVSAGSEADH